MSKKRPNYVVDLVNSANEYLRTRKVTSENDTLFVFVCDYLLKKNMYDGYNFFKDEYNSHLHKNVSVLAGSYKEGEFDYLQIF